MKTFLSIIMFFTIIMFCPFVNADENYNLEIKNVFSSPFECHDFLICDDVYAFDSSDNVESVVNSNRFEKFNINKLIHIDSSLIISIILIIVLCCLAYLIFFDKEKVVIVNKI